MRKIPISRNLILVLLIVGFITVLSTGFMLLSIEQQTTIHHYQVEVTYVNGDVDTLSLEKAVPQHIDVDVKINKWGCLYFQKTNHRKGEIIVCGVRKSNILAYKKKSK